MTYQTATLIRYFPTLGQQKSPPNNGGLLKTKSSQSRRLINRKSDELTNRSPL